MKMENFELPAYEKIDSRLIIAVIPDYGLNMDSQILHRRGKEIKYLFPELSAWSETTLAEAEMYQEHSGNIDRRIQKLSLKEFLTLLFNPLCRAEWGVEE